MNFINRYIDNVILPFTFKLSDEPMLFRELLAANKLFDDGMKLEGKVPGMRIRVGRAVIVFAVFFHLFIILPGLAIFHTPLAEMDCHFAIIASVMFTAFFFSVYFVFKEWMIDRMALRHITTAWKNHFPHFDYRKYHRKVTSIYSKAIEEEIPHKELPMHIMNKLVAE